MQEFASGIPYGKFSLSLIKNTIYLFGGLRKVGKFCEISRDLYSLPIANIKKPRFVKEEAKYGKIIPLADHESAVIDDRYLILIGG